MDKEMTLLLGPGAWPERRDFVAAVLDTVGALVVVLDAHGAIVGFNKTSELVTGYAFAEIKGQRVWDQLLVAEEVESVKAVFASLRAGRFPNQYENYWVTRDGRRRLIAWANTVLANEQGEVDYVIATGIDITDRKRAEEVLRCHTIELEARNEELNAFAHTVAHDLKTPVGLVLGFAQMLGEYGDALAKADRAKCCTEIVRTARRMDTIIHELLLLSKVRQSQIQVEELDMAMVITAALDCVAGAVADVQAEIVAPAEWPAALGHAAWVEEVWVNYLSNALKYGGRPPRVQVGAWPQANGQVQFWVRDNGPGIPAKDQTRLFAPFTRLNQAHARGHGLGLSIVRRIVEKLGGQVGVQSQEGRGSVFSFTLPAGRRRV